MSWTSRPGYEMATPGDLLYVTPVVPNPTGRGVDMRSFAVLEALATRRAVTCLIVPLWVAHGAWRIPTEVSRMAEVHLFEPDAVFRLVRRLLTHAHTRRLAARISARLGPRPLEILGLSSTSPVRRLSGRRFEWVHAFRLCTAPFAEPFLGDAHLAIDLDDLEGDTHRRIASLPTVAPEAASAHRAEALLYDRLLERWVQRADALMVTSRRDRQALARVTNVPILLAPNVIRAPESVTPIPTASPHRITFIGGLDYAPNRDAVTWLVREIVPELCRLATTPWELHVVGRGGRELFAELGVTDPKLVAHGAVPSVAPHIEGSRALIAPIRAGGGTRIKILEALAHGRALVATTTGVEGLELDDGVHLLLGNSPRELAARLVEILACDDLATRLATAGRARILEAYAPHTLARALAGI